MNVLRLPAEKHWEWRQQWVPVMHGLQTWHVLRACVAPNGQGPPEGNEQAAYAEESFCSLLETVSYGRAAQMDCGLEGSDVSPEALPPCGGGIPTVPEWGADIGKVSETTCPEAHRLVGYVWPRRIRCDGCQRVALQEVTYSCRPCNWDLCMACLEGGTQQQQQQRVLGGASSCSS